MTANNVEEGQSTTVVKNDEKYIPTIDLREYFEPQTPTSKEELVTKVRVACLEHGFFQVVGHGVPVESQRAVLEACKLFFDLPMEKKRAMSLHKFSWRRGYEGPGEQKANDPHKSRDEIMPDQKEGFFVAGDLPLRDVGFAKGPNIWPAEEDLASNVFKDPVMEYWSHMVDVGRKIMEVLVVSLGHPPSVLESFTNDVAAIIKLLRYPAHTFTDPRLFGSGQHHDYGGLTILLQQPGQDGLEVWHQRTQQWIELPALEDKFVINLGDMVQRWTGGVYKSTLHRVINKTGTLRYSVPTFWHGDLHATNYLDPNDKSTETVQEFIKKKFYSGYNLSDDLIPVAM
ncbi:putative 2OG-Fe(II) oxygenase family oxidoreductase [Bombardia bombarda]|uniref:2OG-Fe(II) oxygenase family oxidoreductase n=1 Tax=Bombardia bombarda TaxID=252184 RepID=A0AA39WGB5_9PEZI|nr:putative 2OG-Fe(II) oxygenase family oxidoreductase [Bombardia bombarda]